MRRQVPILRMQRQQQQQLRRRRRRCSRRRLPRLPQRARTRRIHRMLMSAAPIPAQLIGWPMLMSRLAPRSRWIAKTRPTVGWAPQASVLPCYILVAIVARHTSALAVYFLWVDFATAAVASGIVQSVVTATSGAPGANQNPVAAVAAAEEASAAPPSMSPLLAQPVRAATTGTCRQVTAAVPLAPLKKRGHVSGCPYRS
mmetsp:Transcript_173836/g.557132  ORF Transcript_173836/g.557132 Transcript_173836/m.557132 type:complete len:200 (+) Transcript_173836:165-764(+)